MNDPAQVGGLAVAPSSGPRLAGVEGLRALAASSIVLVHVWGFSTPGGVMLGSDLWIGDALSNLSLGVTLFFTLSGFLLYRPFAASIARGEPLGSISAYARNRVLRIAPAYWAILGLTALVFGAVNVRSESGAMGFGRLDDPEFLTAALLLQDYRPSTLGNGIGPAWSLAVEAVFYCLLPLLVLMAVRLARGAVDRRRRVRMLLVPPLLLLLVGLSGKAVAGLVVSAPPTAGYGPDWHSVIERSFWAQADLFTFGMLVAVLHIEVWDGRVRLPARWRLKALAVALLIFLPCAWTMNQGEQSYLPQNTGAALAIAIVFATILISERSAVRPSRAVRLLETRALVAVGVASYSLFLWHQPVIEWLETHGLTVGGWGGLLVNLAIVAVVAGTLSALTYRFVERPALRRKRSMRPTQPASASPAVGSETPA